LNKEYNNVNIGKNNNRKTINKDNNFDSQTHVNEKEITRLNNIVCCTSKLLTFLNV